jgi:Mg/Co/Ni transporter MgtE
MLITFKSKAAADIVMYKEHAKRILDLLGKDVDRGIIVHADAKKAIATIEAAIAESRAHPISQQVNHDIDSQLNNDGNHDHESVENVSFSSRAYPLLQMLRAADEEGRDVVWGV